MIQEIITYVILLVTFIAVGLKLYHLLLSFNKKKRNQAGGKCRSCRADCALKDPETNQECPPEPTNRHFIL